MHENIQILLRNLEKIFSPAFFDVMEHLAAHLLYEALLRGPVHYRWMYQYERAMNYLKEKAKNLDKVEGSIIAGSLTEETSHLTSYYFTPKYVSGKELQEDMMMLVSRQHMQLMVFQTFLARLGEWWEVVRVLVVE